MVKLVYLFELDSVRNADDQMELAMDALFREIVVNGNAVAVTFNQLTDSRFFLSLFHDDYWAGCISNLFRLGAIRISQFGNYRTPSQYLVNSGLNSKEEYVFSGLPLKSSQKSLIALVKRSLIYSDLTEISEYASAKRSEAERRILFREQPQDEKDEKSVAAIVETSLSDEEMLKALQDLQTVLKFILQLGDMKDAYNPPKDFDAEKEKLTLCDYFERVKDLDLEGLGLERNEWGDAIKILQSAIDEASHKNRRSDIQKHVQESYKRRSDPAWGYQIAQAILDLCYNYTCEASISNTSKHYDLAEFKNPNTNNPTFEADFKARFKQYFGVGVNFGAGANREIHFLKDESNDFVPYRFKRHLFRNLIRAEHLVRYANTFASLNGTEDAIKQDRVNAAKKLLPYEYDITKQRRQHRIKILFGVGKKLLLTTFYLVIAFCLENIIYDQLEDFVDQWFETTLSASGNEWIVTIVASFLAAVLVELVSSKLSQFIENRSARVSESTKHKWPRIKIPTFGESLENVVSQIGDFICALIAWKTPYENKGNAAKLKPVPREKVKLISFVSKSVAGYKEYCKKLLESGVYQDELQIRMSSPTPIMDILEDEADVRLTRIEELTGNTFGLTHESAYHTMIVDPAIRQINQTSSHTDSQKGCGTDPDNAIYPYERLASAANQPAIVAIPVIYRDKQMRFVLLRQYRHAIGAEQYGFPRGFGENDLPPVCNTQKELWEEIDAVLRNPITNEEIHYSLESAKCDDPTPACTVLGDVTIDSGTQCDVVSIVVAELADYKTKKGYEGILEGTEVSEDQLRQMIANGEINDSFTIEAFALWILNR